MNYSTQKYKTNENFFKKWNANFLRRPAKLFKTLIFMTTAYNILKSTIKLKPGSRYQILPHEYSRKFNVQNIVKKSGKIS